MDDTDFGQDELTFSILNTPGLDGDMFRIVGDQLLFKEGVAGDYEGDNIDITNSSGDLLIDGYGYYYGTYEVEVRAMTIKLYIDQIIVPMVYDEYENIAPVFTSLDIKFNQ